MSKKKLKDKSKGNDDIRFFRYRTYEDFKDYSLEELKKLHECVENGELDLKNHKKTVVKKKKKTENDVFLKEEKKDDTFLNDLKIRRFFLSLKKDSFIIKKFHTNRGSLSFIRRIYSYCDITKNELAYMTGNKNTTIKYYLQKFGIKKIEKEFQIKLKSFDDFKNYLEDNKALIKSETPIDETEEEFRARYKELTYDSFESLKDIIKNGGTPEDVKTIQMASTALSTLMKVELEAKRLLTIEKVENNKLRLKELNKNGEIEPIVLNFNGNITLQNIMMGLKEAIGEMKELDPQMKEAIMVNTARLISE